MTANKILKTIAIAFAIALAVIGGPVYAERTTGGDTLPSQSGNSGKYLTTNGSVASWGTVSGTGDVVGPAVTIDNTLTRYDGTTGKLIQSSAVTVGDNGDISILVPTGTQETKGGINFSHTNGTGTSAYRLTQTADDYLKISRSGDTTGDGAVYTLVDIVSPSSAVDLATLDSEATFSLTTRNATPTGVLRTMDIYNDEYSRDTGMGFRQLYKSTTPNPFRWEFHDKTTNNGAWNITGCTFTNGSPTVTCSGVSGVTPTAEDWIWDNAGTYIPNDTKLISVVGSTYTMNRNATASGSGIAARGKNIKEIMRLTPDRQLLVRKTIPTSSLTVAEFGGATVIDGTLSLKGATSGYTVLQATGTASGTLTFPASTGTLALNNQATDTFGALTDITTNNASTSAHGFLKKLSNSSSQYMDGTGNWSTPAGGVLLPSATACASGCTYSTIQAALDACTGGTGLTIYLTDASYSQGATGLRFKGSNCNIYGRRGVTTIAFTGATTYFKSNSAAGHYSNNGIHDVVITGDGNASSVAIDVSDMIRAIYEGIIIDNVATAFKGDDTQNITFYNRFEDITITTLSKYGFDFQSTNPINDNIFSNIFTGCSSSNCEGFRLRNGNNNKIYGFRAEPATSTGTVGIHFYDAATGNGTFDNQVYGAYLEANGTGIKIDATLGSGGGVTRNSVYGGIMDANGTDIVDNGTETLFLNVDNNFTRFTQMNGILTGSAGVLITGDGDGAITFLGAGNGTDEDLTLNLDDTSNTAVFSSSTGVTKADFGTIDVGTDVLQIASGGSLNFNAGDVTLVHSSNALTLNGGIMDFNGNNIAGMGNTTMTTASQIRTGTGAGNTFFLSARDVDGATYTNFATMTANNNPTFDIQPTSLTVQGNQLIVTTAQTPASSSAACTAGTITWDTGFVYVCTATNTWKRSTLLTF